VVHEAASFAAYSADVVYWLKPCCEQTDRQSKCPW